MKRYVSKFLYESKKIFKDNDIVDPMDQLVFLNQVAFELKISRDMLPFYFDNAYLVYEKNNKTILSSSFGRTYSELKNFIVEFIQKNNPYLLKYKYTIDMFLKNNFDAKLVQAIKNGYEGILWNSFIKDFLDDFYGTDILIKTSLVMKGTYPSWKGMNLFENNLKLYKVFRKKIIDLFIFYNIKVNIN